MEIKLAELLSAREKGVLNCNTCFFFGPRDGKCRVDPPGHRGDFPEVATYDWCALHTYDALRMKGMPDPNTVDKSA